MRIRSPAATEGTPIGVRESARKYGLPSTTITEWASSGEVTVLVQPGRRGEKLLLDELSLQHRLRDYRPHRDSKSRRIRTSPTQATPTAPQLRHPHRSGGDGLRYTPSTSTPGAPSPPGRARIVARSLAPAYNTREMVELFLAHKKAAGCAKDTLDNMVWALKPFQEAFPELPLDKRPMLSYIQGRDLAPGSKRAVLNVLKSFYHWFTDFYELDDFRWGRVELPRKKALPAFFTQEEICQVLATCRDPLERALVITLAQSAIRRGEFASLRRSKLYNGWGMVTGKTGERIAYFPKESMVALVTAFAGKEELYHQGKLVTRHTVSTIMRRLLKKAGVWKKWVGNHAFRHSWQAEFLVNGGNPLYVKTIMGHGDTTMSEHYRHVAIPHAQAEAERCAPRRFLQLTLPMKGAA